MNNVCPCIGEMLATMVAFEAMEHNAVQSKMWLELGKELKRNAPELYEELSFQFPLEYTITEPLTKLGAGSWLAKIEEKCGIDMKDAKDSFFKGYDDMEKYNPQAASHHFTDAKMKLLDKATGYCER